MSTQPYLLWHLQRKDWCYYGVTGTAKKKKKKKKTWMGHVCLKIWIRDETVAHIFPLSSSVNLHSGARNTHQVVNSDWGEIVVHLNWSQTGWQEATGDCWSNLGWKSSDFGGIFVTGWEWGGMQRGGSELVCMCAGKGVVGCSTALQSAQDIWPTFAPVRHPSLPPSPSPPSDWLNWIKMTPIIGSSWGRCADPMIHI